MGKPDADLSVDTRGVSTTLSYVLTLAMTAALISGLLIGTGAVVEQRQESVARDELRVIGEHASSRLMAADRLAATEPTDLTVEGEFPDKAAGSTYTISVNDSGPQSQLRLSTATVDASVTVPFVTRLPVVETAVTGGDLAVRLTDAGELEVSTS
jgi:hypothetical protein